MQRHTRLFAVTLLGLIMAMPSAAHAQHDGDVWIGRTSSGQLAISPAGYVPGDNYKDLLPVSGLLNGWTDNNPGFDRITEPDVENDLFPLEVGAAIHLVVVETDTAFRLVDGAFQILDQPGQSTFLGNHNLHVHNTWHINSSDPLFDPDLCVWHASFYLLDTGSTGYSPSEDLTFTFTNVEIELEPDGDFDKNEVVDLADFEAFAECLSGPGTRPAPGDPEITTCEVDCLNAFDFDLDRDVDLADFVDLQAALGQ